MHILKQVTLNCVSIIKDSQGALTLNKKRQAAFINGLTSTIIVYQQ